MNYAYDNKMPQTASAPPSAGILADIQQALDEALQRVQANRADLSGIADRVLGTQPEPVEGKGGAVQSNPPQLRRLADLAEALLKATEDLGNQVTRFHRL